MRYSGIDFLRGIALIGMILFHTYFACVHIYWVPTQYFFDIFMGFIAKVSAIGFIFIAGISYYFAKEKYGKSLYRKYFKRVFQIWIYAMIISVFTYFFFPGQFIIFWILHFFTVGFFLLYFFRWFWYTNIYLWILCIVLGWYFMNIHLQTDQFFVFWIHSQSFFSADYFPLFPNFWYMLIGFVYGKYLKDSWKIYNLDFVSKNSFFNLIVGMWRKSLFIYMVHMPIIIWVLAMIFYFYWYNTIT